MSTIPGKVGRQENHHTWDPNGGGHPLSAGTWSHTFSRQSSNHSVGILWIFAKKLATSSIDATSLSEYSLFQPITCSGFFTGEIVQSSLI